LFALSLFQGLVKQMLDLWITQVKQRHAQQDPHGLSSLLSPDPTTSSFNLLRQSLQATPVSSDSCNSFS
jgi:hypothetical protein